MKFFLVIIILFKHQNEFSLSLVAKKCLDILVKYIRKNPTLREVKIDGHNDSSHNKNYNKSFI